MPPSRFDRAGSIHIDARGGDRALKVTWHHEAGVVVLSLWRDNVCSASFRLAIEEVPDLVDALVAGLASAYDEVRGQGRPLSATS
ncbi:hypothetical protein ncot_00555 [Nocardioides sp. JQ2195]|uniref:hypothetical protein n=1 Tax=Nocardioides sp. JQ2195 TaxID=2592334 RepID=UPI00143EE8F8|nr:hypothetical protein [Nocardioides sp. JQ2195]QIX25242.1 hypothetical protein ncot_00555 [Nocardioides sp. JQ2195]